MKILHVLYSGLGGHGNVFFSMVDADKEKYFRYEAIFYGVEPAREVYIEKAEARGLPWYYVQNKPGVNFQVFNQITEIIKTSAPDIIFLHSSSYIYPAKRAVIASKKKIRIVVRETQPNHLKTIPHWAGLCAALLVADKVVFLSGEYKESIKKTLPLFFNKKRVAVIPNGIDLDIFKPAAKQNGDTIKIGMQSRISATKDHVTLIRAFNQCLKNNNSGKELLLYIAGEGETRPEVEGVIKELGIEQSVFFVGMLEEDQLSQFINSLDIYVHATLGETMSTAIMQVMASRMPIVASDVLGVNNMIKHKENGLLVPPKDADKMASAILSFINDESYRDSMAENAYSFAVSNYSNQLMFSRYKKLFNQQ